MAIVHVTAKSWTRLSNSAQHSTSITNELYIRSLRFTWVHFSARTFFLYFFYHVFLSNINFPVIFNLVDNDSPCRKVCLYKALCHVLCGTFPKL